MLSICQICLSTEKPLQALKEPLSNWHDELCDFGIEDYALYCPECAYMLNKFHNFKEKCLQANKILKKWKRQNPKVRTQLSKLINEMPPSSIGKSNETKHREFVYHEEIDHPEYSILYSNFMHSTDDKNTEFSANYNNSHNINNYNLNTDNTVFKDASTHVTYLKDITEQTPDNRNILTENCRLKTILIEPCNESEFLKESDVKFEDTLTEPMKEMPIKSDCESDVYNSDHNNANDSDFDVDKLLNDLSDNSSDEEVLYKKMTRSKKEFDVKRDKRKLSDDENDNVPLKKLKVKKAKPECDKVKKVRKFGGCIKKVSVESIKYNLLCKFGNTEVKDEDGNIIDKDCIIESLDKMHKYTLNKVKRHILGSKSFTPEAIQLLSQIQKRYGNQYSSVFTTVHLSTTEQILEEFNKRQQHESYLLSDHKCTLCYRGFKYGKLLEYHISEYHNPERSHVCPICQMRFKSAPGLCKHNAAHRAVYKCKLCPLVTNYRNVMENHYHQHNGVTYTCEVCKAVLNSKPCLNAHMNYMHPSRYICPICARTFVSECGVTQHKIRKHPNEELPDSADNPRCESCNMCFISENVYQVHLAKSHSERVTSANYAHTYKKRQMSGKRQPPNFVCRVCKKVEHSMGRMTSHFKAEHPTENTDTVPMCAHTYKHLCHVCGKGYSNITDYNEHKHVHTGAKPYACDKCPKAFHRRTNLRMHRERHFPPTRECQHCGKKFLSAANLNNHIKMHIGIRRYTCELCAKSFLHRSALNAHVRGVHLRIRRTRKTNKEQE